MLPANDECSFKKILNLPDINYSLLRGKKKKQRRNVFGSTVSDETSPSPIKEQLMEIFAPPRHGLNSLKRPCPHWLSVRVMHDVRYCVLVLRGNVYDWS